MGGGTHRNGGLEFDGSGDYLDRGVYAPSLDIVGALTVTAWVKPGATLRDHDICGNVTAGPNGGGYMLGIYSNDRVELEVWSSAGTSAPANRPGGGVALQAGTWYFLAATYSQTADGGVIRSYVNGAFDQELATTIAMAPSQGTFKIGRDPRTPGLGEFAGVLDDVRVYNHVLTANEFQGTMLGKRPQSKIASAARPEDKQVDVSRDAVLSWTPGIYAQKHDVYFGSALEDVKNANSTSPLGVLVSPNQDANTYAPPDRLDFGKTYYWRIDEVNAPPDSTVYTGDVWSFTTETMMYAIPGDAMTATASSSQDADAGPGKTIDGTVPVTTVSQTSHGPLSLQLGKTYYWRIDEVNMAETSTTWSSDVWSFSTVECLVVDDFEGYTNDPQQGNIMETVIVHASKQSMPLSYDNTAGAAYSETIRTFAPGQNWTQAGIKTLVLYFYGTPGNAGQLYVKVNGAKAVYSGDAADIARPVWRQWNIDLASLGVNLQNVTTPGIGIDGSGASGTLYIDNIRLYASAPALPKEQIWIEAETTTTITAPLEVFSDKPDASGGKYMSSVDAGLARTTAASPGTDGTGLATYKFTVKGGTYAIRVREIVPSTSSDSWWVRIQGATLNAKIHASGWIQWNNAPVAQSWAWNSIISTDDGGKTVLFTMPAGTYTLEMAYREDGCLLDALVITDKLD